MNEPKVPVPESPSPDATIRLLERARAGDDAALEVLFARYLNPLRRWASGRLPRWAREMTDTQDLVQETLLQTFRKLDGFESRGEGALYAYLRQALMNRVRDELRRFERRGPRSALDADAPDAAPSPLDQAIGGQNVERYERALAALRASDRDVLIARLELGCSYDEIAETMGKPSAAAARKAAQRALVRLAEELKRESGSSSGA